MNSCLHQNKSTNTNTSAPIAAPTTIPIVAAAGPTTSPVAAHPRTLQKLPPRLQVILPLAILPRILLIKIQRKRRTRARRHSQVNPSEVNTIYSYIQIKLKAQTQAKAN